MPKVNCKFCDTVFLNMQSLIVHTAGNHQEKLLSLNRSKELGSGPHQSDLDLAEAGHPHLYLSDDSDSMETMPMPL